MNQFSELANQLLHLNRLHASCGEYLPVDLMVSLEHWGTVGEGNNRRYRDADWGTPANSHRQEICDLRNTGSNKRPRVDEQQSGPNEAEAINWVVQGTFIFDKPDCFPERDRRFRPSLELRLRIFRTAFQNYFNRLYNIQRPTQEMHDRDEMDRNAAMEQEMVYGNNEAWRIRRSHARYNNNNCSCQRHHTVETEILNEERAIPRDPALIEEAQRGLEDDFEQNELVRPRRPRLQRGNFTGPAEADAEAIEEAYRTTLSQAS